MRRVADVWSRSLTGLGLVVFGLAALTERRGPAHGAGRAGGRAGEEMGLDERIPEPAPRPGRHSADVAGTPGRARSRPGNRTGRYVAVLIGLAAALGSGAHASSGDLDAGESGSAQGAVHDGL